MDFLFQLFGCSSRFKIEEVGEAQRSMNAVEGINTCKLVADIHTPQSQATAPLS